MKGAVIEPPYINARSINYIGIKEELPSIKIIIFRMIELLSCTVITNSENFKKIKKNLSKW